MDSKKSSAQRKPSGLITAGTAVKSFCLFVLVYGLLMAAWPVVGVAYSGLCQTTGAFLSGSFGHEGIIRFSRSDNSTDYMVISALNPHRTNESGQMTGAEHYYNIRYGFYMHTAFLVALIAATPLPWGRRGLALIWGLILMHAIVALRIEIMTLDLLSNNLVSLLSLDSFWKDVVVTANLVVGEYLPAGFVIAVFIWVLVSFRRCDLSRFALQ
jgi:hypothetical protein